MYIYGGSIDIGRFHILGDNKDADDPDGESEYGHLVQAAKSDFIGVTHFYGNVGIGPSLTDNAEDISYGSSEGNFFQSRGYVAMGIPVTDNGTNAQEVH